MPALRKPKDEAFCQAVASGLSLAEAYRRASGKARDADVRGSEFVVRRGIKERINEIREEQAAKCEMTKDQFRRFLVSVILAKPEDASFNNPLCEVAMTKAGPTAVFPSKLAAAVQLAKLTGWNEVEKVSVEAGDTLSAFLRQIVTK